MYMFHYKLVQCLDTLMACIKDRHVQCKQQASIFKDFLRRAVVPKMAVLKSMLLLCTCALSECLSIILASVFTVRIFQLQLLAFSASPAVLRHVLCYVCGGDVILIFNLCQGYKNGANGRLRKCARTRFLKYTSYQRSSGMLIQRICPKLGYRSALS